MKKNRVTIRLTDEEFEYLDKIALVKEMNISELFRHLIRNEISKGKDLDLNSRFENIEQSLSEILAIQKASEKLNVERLDQNVFLKGLIAVRSQLQRENDALMAALSMAFPELKRGFDRVLDENRNDRG